MERENKGKKETGPVERRRWVRLGQAEEMEMRRLSENSVVAAAEEEEEEERESESR